MTGPQVDRHAIELSRVWDALIEGLDPGPTALDPRLLAVVQHIYESNVPDELRPDLVDEIWENIIAGTAPLWTPEVVKQSAIMLPQVSDRPSPLPEPSHRTWRMGAGVLWSWVIRFAWIVAAGFLGGFVAGIGGRLAMRLAGFLTSDRNRSFQTENGNRVGDITADGTLFLGLLAGGAGIGVVLMYLAIRNRLPGSGWRRSALFSVLLLGVFGYVLMDPGNPDYRLFGSAWLNVTTFSGLYLIMGFCTSQAYELSQHYRGRLRSMPGYRGIRIAVLVISPAVCMLGLLMLVGNLFFTAPGLPIVGLGMLAWIGGRFAPGRLTLALRLPPALRPWGLMTVPAVVGLLLTARGIAEILTG